MISCGNWGWESIDTDNEERLNIFGLISVDDSLESFIIVHKTLDTAGPEEVMIGQDTIYYDAWEYYDYDLQQTVRDTFWFETPWIRTKYESKYIVKDATVIVSDGDHEYVFERAPLGQNGAPHNESYPYLFEDPAIYRNVDGSFIPRAETTYQLSITTESGLGLTGTVKTPPIPRIKENLLPDTVSVLDQFNMSWTYAGDYNTTVATDYSNAFVTEWVCGIVQHGSVESGDTTWVSEYPDWCLDGWSEIDLEATTEISIRLRYLDENYYDYFISTGNEGTISNLLLGEGRIANSFGVSGGFGVFGAISSDWTKRIVTQ